MLKYTTWLLLAIALLLGATHYEKAEASEVNKSTYRGGWNTGTYELLDRLVDVGYDIPLASVLINECKDKADNPRHCVVHGAFIACPESSCGQIAYKNNVFGVRGQRYESRTEAVEVWVGKYIKYWYRNTNPDDYYKSSPKHKPRSWYCIDELQPDGTMLDYCKNGSRHAWSVFNKITK